MKAGNTFKNYKTLFREERKIKNIKTGAYSLTKAEYYAMKKRGWTNREILDEQMIVKQKDKKKLWKQYLKIRNKRQMIKGDKLIDKGFDQSYFGKNNDTLERGEGLGWHKSLAGLLKDKHDFHYFITYRINHGETKEEVLADYGY